MRREGGEISVSGIGDKDRLGMKSESWGKVVDKNQRNFLHVYY